MDLPGRCVRLVTLLSVLATSLVESAVALDLSGLTGGIGISAMRFDYKEYDDAGRVLDRESATLPGLSILLAGPVGDYFWLGEVSLQRATARYVGQTSFAAPHNTNTRETVVDASMQAGRWFASQRLPPYAIYAGIGYREWDRDIQATQTVAGLFETYQWWYGFAGAKVILAKGNQFEWQADVRVLQPIRPTVTIDFKGTYSASPELKLGERPGIRVAFPWRRNLNHGYALSLEPYFEQWNLDRSESAVFRSGRLALTVAQPENITKNFGIRVLWSKQF